MSYADRLARLAFWCGCVALVLFLGLGALGTVTTPPLPQRTDPLAMLWQWLVLSSAVGGSLAGMVALIASISAAVSQRYRPKV